MVGVGLLYAIVVAARWAFKRDAEDRKASRKKVRRRRERFEHPDLTDTDDLIKRAFKAFDDRDAGDVS